MKNAIKIFLMLAAIMLVFAGCATTYTTGNGKLAYAEVKGTEKGDINVSKKVLSILHPSIAVIGTDYYTNLDKMIEPALEKKDANAVKDMTITQSYGIVDFIIAYFTASIINATDVTVEGTAVSQ